MINTKHLLKVISAWTTVIYIICFVGVALLPGIRPWFVHYALHMDMNLGENIMTITTFLSGLAIWNVVALASTVLFAVLHNRI